MVHELLDERGNYEKYLLDNMEQFDIVRINRRELALLDIRQLRTLYEVCKDRKTYDLAKSHLTFDPNLWNDESLKDWIGFVSKKYVDNNKVDTSKGESPALEQELRNYWRSQQKMWFEAARIYDKLKKLSYYRDNYEKILRQAKSMRLSAPHPKFWNEIDKKKFLDWFSTDAHNSSMTPNEFCDAQVKKWIDTLEIIHDEYGINLNMPESMEEEEDEDVVVDLQSEEMSPSSIRITDFGGYVLPPQEGIHSPPFNSTSPAPQTYPPFQEMPFYQHPTPMRYMPEFGDPEDWDRELLSRWLLLEFSRYNMEFKVHNLSERHMRLIMIYVRCAWPCDGDQNSLTGLCRIFMDIGRFIYSDILKMRPPTRTPETVTKPDSQRHRNRRDLHLWEFLLILLANPEYETESIHWKDESRGIFELANRHRVAKLWGLTKGNAKMTYDNMSRSVRQYYKDDKSGIMIRHQTGTQSLGKYSYQFSMGNNEVRKLWKSMCFS